MVAPTPFGPSFEDLTLEDLERALEAEEYEPLTWEAKGIRASRAQVLKYVAGFANSRAGGILILGAEQKQRGGRWTYSGAPMSLEPIVQLDQYIRDGLDPVPIYRPRVLGHGDLGPIIAIQVDPIDVPPCITADGQVFERVSGRTIPVALSADLARLYERGAAAHDRIRREAHDAAYELGSGRDPDEPMAIVLAVAAASLASEISDRIFRPSFEASLRDEAHQLYRSAFGDQMAGLVGPWSERSQGWTSAVATTTFRPVDERITLRVRRHGGIAVALDLRGRPSNGALWIRGRPDIMPAMYHTLSRVLELLDARGSTFLVGRMTAEPNRGSFEADQASDTRSDGSIELGRIVRDIGRGAGHHDPEPEVDVEG